MLELAKREKIIISLFIIVIFLIIGSKFFLNQASKPVIVDFEQNNIEDSKILEESEELKEKAENPREIVVDVCGEVNNPGVIRLREGDRVVDAVNVVGGLLETADRKMVNLARIVQDGEQIYIPKIGENIQELESSNQSSGVSKYGKVNINKASQSELESLNGIGQVLAQRIIQYREENGAFKNIEDIIKVSGIGTKKYEAIKDSICTQ